MDTKEDFARKFGAGLGKAFGFCIISLPFTLFMTWLAFYHLGIEWCFDYGFGIWILLYILRVFVVDE